MLRYSVKNNSLEASENVSQPIYITILLMTGFLALMGFAIYRALICSSKAPDSKVLHLLFATIRPLWYILFSFTVEGLGAKS